MSPGPPTSGSGEQPAQPAVPAGWYPHPTAPGWEAYWTGTEWGAETRPAESQPEQPAAAEQQAGGQVATGVEPGVAAAGAAGAGAAGAAAAQGAPAEAQPAEAQPAEAQPVEAQPVEGQPAEAQPGAGEPAAAQPAGAQPAQAQPAEAQPAEAQPAEAQPAAAQPAAAQPAQAQPEVAQQTGTPPPRAAEPTVPAAPLPNVEPVTTGGSRSTLPTIICVLGAAAAVAGSFLPQATLEFKGAEIDLVDNTMIAAGYGIAVVAAAVLGAGIAIWAYANRARTLLPLLLGIIVLAIAAYAGTAGLEATPSDVVQGLPTDTEPDPTTGIFAAAAGGLLMILGGIGFARVKR